MNTKINIENYEEIMFRLMENDFDESTRIDLLRQIESDALFIFEWESWQKTKFVDPLENYAIESSELTEKIILIAGPKPAGKKRFFYYWAAAASILVLIACLFLLTADFNTKPRQDVAEKISKSQTPVKSVIAPVQNITVSIAIADRKQSLHQQLANKFITAFADSNTILPIKITQSEIPKVIDSVPAKTNELAKTVEKKPRYTITIETSDISGSDQQDYVMAQREKVKIGKVFTNTKMFLRRKPNGEPDRLILVGDDNSYVCLNLNY
jgi:predicted nucleic acid-binding protein